MVPKIYRDLCALGYTARNSFSGILGYIFSNIFRHLSAKGKGLKIPDAHPYPQL